LAKTGYPDLRVILVDNASTDDSVVSVRSRFPDVVIIENEQNLGFAEGNNVGLRVALAGSCDCVMLLNNDAVVEADTLAELLEPLVSDTSVGVTSGAISYFDQPELVWSAGGTIDRKRGIVASGYYNRPIHALPTDPYDVDHVSGCCMMLRADAIRAAGLLDPRFFMYYEETEWCVRFARLGYRLVVNPRARILHAIDPLAQEGSPAIAYYMTRNHLLFLRATKAPLSAWTWTIGWQLRTISSLFLKRHSPARVRGRRPMLWAMRDFCLGRFGALELAR
jgi:hypothetical protein